MKYTNFNGFCRYLAPPSLKPKIKFYKALVLSCLFISTSVVFGQCDITALNPTCANMASSESTIIDLSTLVCDAAASSSFTVSAGGLYAVKVSDQKAYSFTLTPSGNNIVDPVFPGVMDLFQDAAQTTILATSGPVPASAGMTPTTMSYTDSDMRSNDLFLAIWDKACAGSWKNYTLTATCTSCSLTCAPRQVIAGNDAGCVSELHVFAAPTFTGPCAGNSLELTDDDGSGATLSGNFVTVPAGTAAGIYTLDFAIDACSDAVASTCTTEVIIEPTSSCNSGNINLSSLCSTPISPRLILSNLCAAEDQYTIYINNVNTNIVDAAGTYQVSVRYTPTNPNGTLDTDNAFYNKELCWQNITFEDKSGPSCNLAQADTEYNFVCGFETATAVPTFTDCSGTSTENPVQELTIGDCGAIAGVTTDTDNNLINDFDATGMISFMGMSIPAPSEDEANTLSAAGFALEKIIKKSFSATDGTNTGSACDQFIYIWRPTIIEAPETALITCGLETTPIALAAIDPQLVPYYANPLYDDMADSSAANDFSSTDIQDPNFVSTKVDDNGNPEFVAIAGQDHNVCKFIVTNEDGVASNPCGNTTKFVRRYTVLNCCTNEILVDNVSQYIETIDNVAPVFGDCPTGTALGTITNPRVVTITESNTCNTTVDFASIRPTATDACSSPLTYNASFYSVGTDFMGTSTFVTSGMNPVLNKGNYRVEVTATDGCSNISTVCTVYLKVDDGIVPSLLCATEVSVSVDNNGNGIVCAADNVSANDNCGIIAELEVKKMVDGDDTFASCINISCEDGIEDANGNFVVQLIYRATDACGNTNTIMCAAQVQIKVTPTFVCPANVTVECTDFDPLDTNNLYGPGPTVDGVCGLMFDTRFENGMSQPGTCTGSFMITRTYYLTLEGQDVASCNQTIFVEDTTPPTFDVAIVDITAECSAIPTGLDITATDSCPEGTIAPLTTVTFSDIRTDGDCTDKYTITRTFIATDDCGNSVEAIQNIAVSDNTAPTFINAPGPITVGCNNIPPATLLGALDNCDTNVVVSVVDGDPVANDCPNDNSFMRTFTATDNCGNTAIHMQLITVLPTPLTVERAPDVSLPCTDIATYTFTAPTVTESVCGPTNHVVTGPVIVESTLANGDMQLIGTYTITDDCGINTEVSTTATFTDCCVDVLFGVLIECSTFSTTTTLTVELGPATSVGVSSNLTFKVQDLNVPANNFTVAANTPLTVDKGEYSVTVCSTSDDLKLCPVAAQTVTCTAMRIAGRVFNEEFTALEEVEVELMNTEIPMSMTDVEGEFNFEGLEDQAYTVAAHKASDPLNGISTFDLVVMAQHVLGINELDSPYKLLAADINMDQKIDINDMVEMRQLILYAIDDFTVNTSWRFVNADYIFPDPQNPWLETIPETYRMEALRSDTEVNFVAVKIGDLDCSAETKMLTSDLAPREAQSLVMHATDEAVKAGNTFDVVLRANQELTLSAVQFTLNFDPTLASLEKVSSQALSLKDGHVSQKYAAEGLIPFAWYTHDEVDFDEAAEITLTFTAKEDLSVAEFLAINSSLTEAMAYTPEGIEYDLSLQVQGALEQDAKNGFVVYQNSPNPFHAETLIGYEVAQDELLMLTVFDLDGKLLFTKQLSAVAGYNSVVLTKQDIQKTGVLFYQIDAANYTMTKKMIILD